MKKVLTVLGFGAICSTLFACNPDNKVTKITIDALPYALSNKWYSIDLNVEGKGTFSKDVTWTTSYSHAIVSSDCKFQYMSSMISDPIDVVITATSTQDQTIKANFTIKVLANSIDESEFLDNATKGDENRLEIIKEAGEATKKIVCTVGDNDFIEVYGGTEKLQTATYTIKGDAVPATSEETTLSLVSKSVERYKYAPTSKTLKSRFENFKESGQNFSCFESANKSGITYGYVTAIKDSSGTYNTEVTIYQYGFPITYWYYNGNTQLDNINLELNL